MKLSPFESVLEDLRAGRMIILVDDSSRENEGDLVALSASITTEQIAFMMDRARGLICVTLGLELAEELHLPLQSSLNLSSFDTPFAVSIDHMSCTGRGVEASARQYAIRKLIDPNSSFQDFVSPGSVYPLIAHPKGVLGRRGQTEGSYDLARIVGSHPSAVICEILNEDGTMARGKDLEDFARLHGLKITSVEEILQYRIEHEPFFQIKTTKSQEIMGATFEVSVIEDDFGGKEHLFLWHKSRESERPLVRIHSECLTGDVFGSRRCDCGAQLSHAITAIIERGFGAIIYLRQEGRGIGLANKIKAYHLQDAGLDTVDANIKLGFGPDMRDYRLAAKIFLEFGFRDIDLLTNNPEKVAAMLEVCNKVSRVPLLAEQDEFNEVYLKTKKHRMGHIL
jgi:3,4-dihydroxy 2-butanone 4-phosphate synthase/GTP cyclohydrolase II